MSNNFFAYRSSILKLPEKYLPPTKRHKLQQYKASLLEPLPENGAHRNETSVDTSSTRDVKDEPVLKNNCTAYVETSCSFLPPQRTDWRMGSTEVSSRESQVSAPQSNYTTSLQGSSQDKTEDSSMGKVYVVDNTERQLNVSVEKRTTQEPLQEKQVESDASSGEIPLEKLETMEAVNHNWDDLKEEVRVQLQSLFQEGVVVPEDFDERAFQFLVSLPPNRAIEALTDLSERNFSNVKKRKAFIMSVLRQHSPDDTRWSSPPHKLSQSTCEKVPVVVPPSALSHLSQPVADGLQQVFASGVCPPSKFDDLAMEVLVSLEEEDAVQALKEFANVDPSTVRNPSAFWMGIARRYQIRAKRASVHPHSSTTFYGNENFPSRKMSRPSGEWHRPHTEYNASNPSPQAGFPSNFDRFETTRKRPHHDNSKIITEYIEELTRRHILAPGALDEKVVDTLKRIPQADALTVLRELEHLDQRRIRNISAFVTGLIRKVTSGDYYQQQRTSPTSLVDELEPRVRQRYLSLFSKSSHLENKGGLDDRALEALSNLRPELSLQVLDELSKVDTDQARNISMIAMGIMKKVTQRDNHERNVRN